MRKYLSLIALFIIAIIGTYYLGYKVGSANTRVEYVIKEREASKYVEKGKANIYSKPNISRDTALQLFHQGKL